jgi:hypothetical protein
MDDVENRNVVVPKDSIPPSVLPWVLNAVGIVELVAGVVLCLVFLPGKAEYGYEWKVGAYMSSMVWLFSGLVSAIFTFGFAKALSLLEGIYMNTPK